jgi:hypothetical protein
MLVLVAALPRACLIPMALRCRGMLAPRIYLSGRHALAVCSFNAENLYAPTWIPINPEGSL